MLKNNSLYIILIAFTAAIGGFLLGFDGSVISGAAPFYKSIFGLEDGSFLFGFSVSCLILGCIFGNFFAGSISDKIGRKPTLLISAFLFIVSSLIVAFAGNIIVFIIGRVLAGVAVGFAILVAPVYIAELAPAKKRGWLVSFNQLLIVIGLSAAYFSNYFIVKAIDDPSVNWRWMLGVEAIPSVVYFILILFIPESPRWLIINGQYAKAKAIMLKIGGETYAEQELQNVKVSLNQINDESTSNQAKKLFSKSMISILIIGFGLAVFQQLSGINAILYYAPMIFESAGSGRDASFMQAAVIGLVFMIMTIAAMLVIDKIGRKPLLYLGTFLMAVSLLIAGITFNKATYTLDESKIENICSNELKSEIWKNSKFHNPQIINLKSIDIGYEYAIVADMHGKTALLNLNEPNMLMLLNKKKQLCEALMLLKNKKFENELFFKSSVKHVLTGFSAAEKGKYTEALLKEAININAIVVLISILSFIAGFSISLGPVMWALFSEIFPNRLRGMAISIVGTANSLTSFVVATVFPIQLSFLGSGTTYFIYAGFMFLCLWFIWKYVIETKGKTLEEIEMLLVRIDKIERIVK